jgi:hypothetical protein
VVLHVVVVVVDVVTSTARVVPDAVRKQASKVVVLTTGVTKLMNVSWLLKVKSKKAKKLLKVKNPPKLQWKKK